MEELSVSIDVIMKNLDGGWGQELKPTVRADVKRTYPNQLLE